MARWRLQPQKTRAADKKRIFAIWKKHVHNGMQRHMHDMADFLKRYSQW